MQIKIQQPYAFTEKGKRISNEDCIFPEKGKAGEQSNLFIVCDGIGESQGGGIIAGIVSKSLASFIQTAGEFNSKVFQDALEYTYKQFDKLYEDETLNKQSGTTLALLYLHEKGAFMAHIGDSRIYHLRKNDYKMEIVYKTEDHSYVNNLIKSGTITPGEADKHPKKNVITRSIQAHPEERDKIDIYETTDICPGDYFFLCTDGVLEQLEDSKLCSTLNLGVSLEKKTQFIFNICSGKSKDNFSAYLISVTDVKKDDSDYETEDSERNPQYKKWLIALLSVLIVCGAIWGYSEFRKSKDSRSAIPEKSKPFQHTMYNWKDVEKTVKDSLLQTEEVRMPVLVFVPPVVAPDTGTVTTHKSKAPTTEDIPLPDTVTGENKKDTKSGHQQQPAEKTEKEGKDVPDSINEHKGTE